MIVDKPPTVAPPSRRERLRVMMFDDILAAARQIVQEHGFKELSMRALGRAVGVTAPTLYDYFPSKDAVLDALFLEAVRMMQRDFEIAVASESSGPGKLQAIAHAYRRFASNHPDLFMLLFGRIDSTYRPGEPQMITCMGLKEMPGKAVVDSIMNGEMRQCDPEVAAHLLEVRPRQVAVQEQGLARMLVIEHMGPRRHARQIAQHDRAIGQHAVLGGFAHLAAGNAAVEIEVMPEPRLLVGVGQAVALDDDHIATQGIEHIGVRQRQHLAGIVDARGLGRKFQGPAQRLIGERRNAGRAHAVQILRQPVNRLEIEGRHDAFAGVHVLITDSTDHDRIAT